MNKPKIKVRTKGNSIQNLLIFIETELNNFTNSQEFIDILEQKKNEDQHSTAFCVFMTNKCKARYCFMPENAQYGSYKIDIGVYEGSILIFTIEAKVLPTPKGTASQPRDSHEYVYRNIGSGAGIERFKIGVHGVDNSNNALLENGMIAYIKEQDFDYWQEQVNQWILDARSPTKSKEKLHWSPCERLEFIDLNNPQNQQIFAKFISKHLRIDNTEVILYHFWVKV
jgi:hypothetical protein